MRPQRFVRTPVAVIAASLIGLLAGCGSSDSSTGDAASAGSATTLAPSTAATTPADAGAGTSDAATTAAAEGSVSGSADDSTPEQCSADGSETPLDPLATDTPAVAVRAESATSPLPDVTLRRVNCNPGFVNLKNELPADTPVLFWFWAPF